MRVMDPIKWIYAKTNSHHEFCKWQRDKNEILFSSRWEKFLEIYLEILDIFEVLLEIFGHEIFGHLLFVIDSAFLIE